MPDGIVNLIITLWGSDGFKLLVMAGVVYLLWAQRNETKRLRKAFEKHVSDESQTFTELRKDIQTIKGNDLEHLAKDIQAVAEQVTDVGQKVDQLMFHLMDKKG